MDQTYSIDALKRNAGHFLFGKVFSAVLTFSLLLLLVRKLPIAEYGAYIILLASMDVLLSIADVGLHTLGIRYIPEFMVKASSSRLRWLLIMQIGSYAMMATVVALLVLLCFYLYGDIADFGQFIGIAKLYLLVVVIEGVARLLRDQVLSSMMLQSLVRVSLIARLVLFVAGIIFMDYFHELSLIDVVWIELLSSLAGLLVSLAGLRKFIISIQDKVQDPTWREPAWFYMWKSSFHLYISMLISMLYGESVFMLLIKNFFGLEVVAVFGFIFMLMSQVGRYLPVTLFFGLIQPKLVASYVESGDIRVLFSRVNMAGKLNLFVLFPLLAFIGANSDVLLSLISGGKFTDDGILFFCLMLMLIPASQRALLEAVVMVVRQGGIYMKASISCLVVLPVFFILFYAGFSVWSVVISMLLAQYLFMMLMVFGLRRKVGYREDMPGLIKLVFSVLISYFSIKIFSVGNGYLSLSLDLLICLIVYFLILFLLKPFLESERNAVNSLFGRNFFCW